MKLRVAGTLSAAISEIKNRLSEQECAKIVDRSESLIRKWADPDDPALPNLRQSLLLDAAYIHGGFGEPPIQAWYVDRLDKIVSDDPNDAEDIIVSTLRAQASLGQIAAAVNQFTDGSSEHGKDLSSNERAVLLNMVQELSLNLDRLEHTLQEDVNIPGPISFSEFLEK